MASDDFEFSLNAKVTRVSEKQMLDSLRAFAQQVGGRPFTTMEYDGWKDKVCHSSTISDRLGSWRGALARVGIDKGVRARRYSPRDLMDNLERVWRELGRPPGKRSMTRHGSGISERPYRARWESLRKACDALARFKGGEITEQELLGGTPSARARRALPLKLRWDVLKRDDYKCVACGARPPDVTLEVDHIVAKSRGGKNELANLRTLCTACNQGKKDR
ncbi:MAG: HNH endonuclease [Phycisphaerae bacterium]|jgi:hypothetical protein